MDSKKDRKEAMDALRDHVEQTAQNAIQLISDYVYHSDSLSFSSIQELKYSKRIFTILLSNPSKSKPLSIISLFDFNENSVEDIVHQICIIFTACGFEIKKDGSNYPFVKDEFSTILSLRDFILKNNEFSIFSEHGPQETDGKCSIFLSSFGEKIEIISTDNCNSKHIGVLERQLSLFFAAINNTVNISDGSIINNYGCVVSPVDVNESK